jgi:hypothetical protein
VRFPPATRPVVSSNAVDTASKVRANRLRDLRGRRHDAGHRLSQHTTLEATTANWPRLVATSQRAGLDGLAKQAARA